MKTDDKILKYLAGILEGEELIKFEKELSEDSGRREQVNQYNFFLADVNKDLKQTVSDHYFTSLLPKVREKISAKDRSNSLYGYFRYAAGMAMIVLAFFTGRSFIPDFQEMDSSLLTAFEIQEIMNSNGNEFSLYLNERDLTDFSQYSADFSHYDESLLDEFMASENSFDETNVLGILDDIVYTEQLSDSVFNNIYDQLKGKEIF
ncbi:MAG: hypothetical protein K9I69_03625 [Ignavibacteriales bacterium]|nr:hypothetical protein [Ignavibacteriales bacterium]MCF8305380.1 hypothetical protein [Ignavibacteriales bacterium]MCF8316063.1 hypothetical protein [Ignavibacteriales bacterium]MCF8436565.1 hypothetical protein [Ignavibacteriales bacterium]